MKILAIEKESKGVDWNDLEDLLKRNIFYRKQKCHFDIRNYG